MKDTRRLPGFQVYVHLASGVMRLTSNSQPRGGSCWADSCPNCPLSCLVSCCPDCSRNRFPGYYPGYGPSYCPRCSLGYSTDCLPGCPGHCGPSSSTGCRPRCSPDCSPSCSEDCLPNCPPSCSAHCCPDCTAGNIPDRTFKRTSLRPNPYHGIRLAGTGPGFAPRYASRRARAVDGHWIAGAQLPLFPIRWPERRQPCCRTPKQLPLHDDLADARRL